MKRISVELDVFLDRFQGLPLENLFYFHKLLKIKLQVSCLKNSPAQLFSLILQLLKFRNNILIYYLKLERVEKVFHFNFV